MKRKPVLHVCYIRTSSASVFSVRTSNKKCSTFDAIHVYNNVTCFFLNFANEYYAYMEHASLFFRPNSECKLLIVGGLVESCRLSFFSTKEDDEVFHR